MEFIFVFSRSLTATIDKTTSNRFHDFVLKNFGLTPFIETFPDFSAGVVIMVPALFIAVGFEVRNVINSNLEEKWKTVWLINQC